MKAILDAHAERSFRRRKIGDFAMRGLLVLATLVGTAPLFLVLGYVVSRGLPALDLSFFTQLPKPVGESGGGMGNALVGTAILVALGSLIGVVWGILTGLFLSEYGTGRLGTLVRFSCDMLVSVPSIVVGLFVYATVVQPMRRFSALAGGLALGIIMVPIVARSTEELLKLVPDHIREAGLALGLSRWKVTLRIVLRGASAAVLTGVLLALARVAGETAPLLFTSLGNRFWQSGLDQPISSVPVQIYTYAISPFDEWHRQAWAGALVLVGLVFAVNLACRFLFRRPEGV